MEKRLREKKAADNGRPSLSRKSKTLTSAKRAFDAQASGGKGKFTAREVTITSCISARRLTGFKLNARNVPIRLPARGAGWPLAGEIEAPASERRGGEAETIDTKR